MRKPLLLVIAILFMLRAHAQNPGLHYIKFVHVGERIMPVHALNICLGGTVPRDSTELLQDTLSVVTLVTDEPSYKVLEKYVADENFKFGKHPGRLEFGTFKIINEGKRFYLPDAGVTSFFKKMVKQLQLKKVDPLLIEAIVNNYPWIFNP
jgi:hypothetical protein